MPVLEALVGSSVAVSVTRSDPVGVGLYAEEQAEVARAVPGRRAEFATVRHCARTALATLGVPPGPIPRGARGAPVWPAGIVGSMTHCVGYRAAAVARATDHHALGIDAEPDEPLPRGVLDLVSLPPERTRGACLAAAEPDVCWDRLLFSAKESVYKAWFPLTGRWLDFSEAEVVLATEGDFVARLLVPGPVVDGRPLSSFTGRWSVRSGVITTAVAVPAGRGGGGPAG